MSRSLPTPPRVVPVYLDCCFDHGSGWQTIHAGRAFEGENLRFSARIHAWAGNEGRPETVQIDARTGAIMVPTGRPHDGKTIRVRAENAAGQTETQIQITVEDDGIRATATRMRDLVVDGVVFQFATDAPVGRFISGSLGLGDPFVIGPVTLDSYRPGPTLTAEGRMMHGAMLNPPCTGDTGFDSMATRDTYAPELNAGLRLPLRLEPGDRLVVGVSNPAATEARDVADRFVVLTCLAVAPFEDAFRPPYSGPDLPIWRLSDLRLDRLPSLSEVGRLRGTEEQRDYERRMARFALDIIPTWNRNHLSTPNHPPLYGRDLCHDEAEPYLWAITDRPLDTKVEVLIGLVQRGIDRYGVFRSALEQGFHPWRADGAHNSGRKLSILFAGRLLDDPDMLSVMAQGRAVEDGFQEDAMTFHVTPEIVALSNSADWTPSYRDNDRYPKQPYTDGMVGMPDWRGNANPAVANAAWNGHLYRVSGNHNTQHAQVLTILAMGLREAWDHEAYFDYHMRFCEILAGRSDPWRFRGATQALYDPVTGSMRIDGWDDWERRWHSEWSWQMLMEHRDTFYSYPWS